YVLADRASLFILRREPPSCVAVEYFGHEPGSIPCAPARLGRYLVIPENHTLTSGRWTVFLLDEEGEKIRKVQTIPTDGWTWDTPDSQGAVVWAVNDRGGVTAYSIGPYDAKVPFKAIAQIGAEGKPLGPAFARAKGEREVWVSSARAARYDLNLERG